MHFVEAKGILSSNNGIVRMVAFIVTAEANVMDLHMILKI